jgi:hypothetical protein
MKPAFRRIVTGHDADGNTVILSDAPTERIQRVGGETGPMFYKVWNTRDTPAKMVTHTARRISRLRWVKRMYR